MLDKSRQHHPRTLLACALCGLCCLLLAWSAAGATADDTLPPDIARIQQAGELRVALTRDDYPPFYQTQAGEPRGFDIELATDVAQNLNVKVKFLPLAGSWDDLVNIIATHQADVAISALSRTLPRALSVAYTQPYITLPQALLINRLKLAELETKGPPLVRLDNPAVRIGTRQGSSYMEFAQAAFPKARIVAYEHWGQSVQALLAGDIHAVMFDALQCRRTLLANPQYALKIQLLITKYPDPFAMAVNWNDRALLHWLNVYIDTVRDEGYLQQLENQYIGAGVLDAGK
jgi:polar amino acid transport system substrate-binding protein